ncbi:hypothetical protein O181_048024 [Austropuccinia psidii MF-1]|uniref:Uncharacterized protein n=1 Tax=Austropuccinia psidii MF-1 TaxID=1389203 RepID=A0A9Q3DS05_9BASI|nr:hypothetical protein [Austropuccinia psidii MF-1]
MSELLSHSASIVRIRGLLVFNRLLLSPPGANSATLEKKCSMAKHRFPENPRRIWRRIKKGERFGLEAPFDEPQNSDATSGHTNLTGSTMRGAQQWNNTTSSWENTGGPIQPQGNPIGVAPEVLILVTTKDRRLGKLKRNLVAPDDFNTDA